MYSTVDKYESVYLQINQNLASQRACHQKLLGLVAIASQKEEKFNQIDTNLIHLEIKKLN